MSSSETGPFTAIGPAAEAALADARRALAEERTAEIPDETVQQLLTAGVKLFARKVELEERFFGPFDESEVVTATDVVTAVCEMLRAADLNTFDLSMWFARPR
jgi:hypothetical protein